MCYVLSFTVFIESIIIILVAAGLRELVKGDRLLAFYVLFIATGLQVTFIVAATVIYCVFFRSEQKVIV